MTTFEIHTIESAPEAAKPILTEAKKSFGAIPNLLGAMAESPATLQAYLQIGELAKRSGAFSTTEHELISLAASFENDCEYCMAAHSAVASGLRLPADLVKALREGETLADPRLEALAQFTRAVVRDRGFVSDTAVEVFLAAGYTKRHVLEVVLGVSVKTLSTYAAHIAAPPVDVAFQRFGWSHPTTAAH